jgi:hypothetical protein
VRVDSFWSQTAAQDVVRAGHDFDARAVEVSVQIPGRQEQALARLEPNQVQEQGAGHTDVVWVQCAEPRSPGEFSGELGMLASLQVGRRQHRAGDPRALALGCIEQELETSTQADSGVGLGERFDVGR